MTPTDPNPSPTVSVIVPVYNHARYLRLRLDSILQQTYQDFELIILDDASTDGSVEIIRTYLDRPGVRFHPNQVNSGSAFRQWARGLELARGRYVWIAESDDWSDPKFLERLVPLLDRHPGVGLAYCQSWMADPDGRILGEATGWTDELDPERWRADFIAPGREEVRRYLTDRNTIPNASAVLIRRQALEAAGPLETGHRLCGDWLLWIKLLAGSDLAYVAEPLNFWRQNSSNARAASNGTLEWLEGEGVLRYAAEVAGLDAAATQEVLFRYLRRCWQWQREYIEGLPPVTRAGALDRLRDWLKR
jgi:glycosyltransferase involved in cell wall biosynthesis